MQNPREIVSSQNNFCFEKRACPRKTVQLAALPVNVDCFVLHAAGLTLVLLTYFAIFVFYILLLLITACRLTNKRQNILFSQWCDKS